MEEGRMFEKIFDRGWYKVADRHSSSPAMLALQNLSGDLNAYGLYMFLYDTTVQTDGEIKTRDLKLYCETKAMLDIEKTKEFLALCEEYEVIIPNEDESKYMLPEVKAYLAEVEILKRNRQEASRRGGLATQAKSRGEEPQLSNVDTSQGHYMPYMAGQRNY